MSFHNRFVKAWCHPRSALSCLLQFKRKANIDVYYYKIATK